MTSWERSHREAVGALPRNRDEASGRPGPLSMGALRQRVFTSSRGGLYRRQMSAAPPYAVGVTDEVRRDRRDLRRPSPRVRRRRVIAAAHRRGRLRRAARGRDLRVRAASAGGAGGREPQSEHVRRRPRPARRRGPTPRSSSPSTVARSRSTTRASLWVVVNKLRPLNPQDYAAPDLVRSPVPYVNAPTLRQEAADQIVAMFAAYTAETGNQMQAQSAYRSYGVQVNVYQGWVNSLGQEGADLTSARPGHSEHQTGLAMDISAVPASCALDQCFADTDQGKWLAANAYKWGFILRYPNGMTDITGYEFEPWHYRYVGVALATEMHDTGIQMELVDLAASFRMRCEDEDRGHHECNEDEAGDERRDHAVDGFSATAAAVPAIALRFVRHSDSIRRRFRSAERGVDDVFASACTSARCSGPRNDSA